MPPSDPQQAQIESDNPRGERIDTTAKQAKDQPSSGGSPCPSIAPEQQASNLSSEEQKANAVGIGDPSALQNQNDNKRLNSDGAPPPKTSDGGIAKEAKDQQEGTYPFKKGKSYLVVGSRKEQRNALVTWMGEVRKSAETCGYTMVEVDIDDVEISRKGASKPSSHDYNKFFYEHLDGLKFDAIIWVQHGGMTGPEDTELASRFKDDIARQLNPYLNRGGDIVMANCYGVFEISYLDSVAKSFRNASNLYYAFGYNEMTSLGISSLYPYYEYIAKTGKDAWAKGRYTPWIKH